MSQTRSLRKPLSVRPSAEELSPTRLETAIAALVLQSSSRQGSLRERCCPAPLNTLANLSQFC